MAAVRESLTPTIDAAPAGTSQAVNLPATINADDLLLMIVSSLNGNPETPAGWTLFDEGVTNNEYGAQYWRRATGAEGATVAITTALTPAAFAAQVLRYSNVDWTSNPEAAAKVFTASASADPPSLTATWGADENTFVAVVSYADDAGTISSYPAGYSNGTNTVANGGTNSSACVGSADLQSALATNDPGAFTLSELEAWVTNTIVIRGLPDVAGGGISIPIVMHHRRLMGMS